MDENQYLVRFSAGGEWRDEVREVVPAVEKQVVISEIPSVPRLKPLAKKKKGCIEIDLIFSPSPLANGPGGRPYFPYLLLIADASSGVILPGLNLLLPFPTLDAMYGKVAEHVCQSLLQAGTAPTEIRVKKQLLAGVLAPLADELGLHIKLQEHLPRVEEAAEALNGVF